MAARNITKEAIEFLTLSGAYDDVIDEFDEYEYDWEDYDQYEYVAACPQCKRSYNIVHSECGEYVDICNCPSESSEQVYHCFACSITFDAEGESEMQEPTVKSLFDDDFNHYYQKSYKPIKPYSQKANLPAVKSCSHKHDKIELVDGFAVYCSSVNYSNDADDPDFGLYADYSWRPTWRNEFINWPDFGIPKDRLTALNQISDAYDRILQGEMVEIGCIGGHGRTGTILGCLYLLAQDGNVTPKEAYDYVKKSYCISAIESQIQEWFLHYASHVWFDTELPEEPVKPAPKSYNYSGNTSIACGATNHYSMMIRGWTTCADKGDQCSYWKIDYEKYLNKDVHPIIWEKANELESLKQYDYMYGGLRLLSDPELSPCKPIDHYAMILNGHETCIRLGDECLWWVSDYSEYINHTTINQVGIEEWKLESERVDFYTDFYPTAEELETADD